MPKNIPVLPTHLVPKAKRNATGQPVRFKTRVVAGGHHQAKGRDYEKVYSPVLGFDVFRLMVILALVYRWHMRHKDIKTAFLNGDIDREIYLSHPVNIPPPMKSSNVYLLLKSIYGLHQASLQWSTKFRATLVKLGYTQLKSEECCFQKE